MHSLRRLLACLAVSATMSCGGSAGTEPTADVVAMVAVTPTTSTISVGAQLPLQAEVKDPEGRVLPDAAVLWSTEDASIANVSAAGVVTAVKLGTTKIAANYNGKSAIATITVQKTPVATVTVQPGQVTAVAGSRTTLTAVAYDAAQNALADRGMAWTSSNQAVATVDGAGVVSAVGIGSATITAASEGKSASATITVSAGAVATVAVTPSPVSLTTGQSTQLAVTMRDASGAVVTGRAVVWTSSNTAVATVSPQGVVTGSGAGSTTITATSEGRAGSASVTVTRAAVGSVAVSPSAPTVVSGTTSQLTATLRDVNNNVVTDRAVDWTTSDARVATVSQSGVVTGLVAGRATITATSEGKVGTASVTVTPGAVSRVTIAPKSPPSIKRNETVTFTATATDAAGNAITGRSFTWKLSTGPATYVQPSLVVTGAAIGSVTVTVTLDNVSDSAVLTVR